MKHSEPPRSRKIAVVRTAELNRIKTLHPHMIAPIFAADMEPLLALFIPIIAIVMGIGIAALTVYLNYRKRKEMFALYHQERMLALEKGVELPPLPDDLLTDEGMSARAYNPRRHLLKGLVWLFIGLGLIVALYAVVDPRKALFGLIPAGIGLAHLIYYAVEGKKEPVLAEQQPAGKP